MKLEMLGSCCGICQRFAVVFAVKIAVSVPDAVFMVLLLDLLLKQ